MKKSEMIEALATKTGLTKTECEKVDLCQVFRHIFLKDCSDRI